MSKDYIEKIGKSSVDRAHKKCLLPEELKALDSGKTLPESRMEDLRKCPTCSHYLSLFYNIDDICKQDAIPQKLGATLKSKLAEFRSEKFHKITSGLIAEIYPDKLDQWEKDWETYFADKSAGKAIESAIESWRDHESMEQKSYREVVSGIGSIWDDIEDHRVDDNQAFLRDKLKESGISVDISDRILSYLENKK